MIWKYSSLKTIRDIILRYDLKGYNLCKFSGKTIYVTGIFRSKISNKLNNFFFCQLALKAYYVTRKFFKRHCSFNVFSKFFFYYCKKIIRIVSYCHRISFYFVTTPYTYILFSAIIVSNFIFFSHFFHIFYVFVEKLGVILLFTIPNKVIRFVSVVFISMIVKLVFIFQKGF